MVDEADHMAAYLEAVHLAAFGVDEARAVFGVRENTPGIELVPWAPAKAREAFLAVHRDRAAGGSRCLARGSMRPSPDNVVYLAARRPLQTPVAG